MTGRWTTHEWERDTDLEHIAAIRADSARFAAGGVEHLVLEVVAYAVDEAVAGTTTQVDVVLGQDRTMGVQDDGRGTDVRPDDHGRLRVKPVMATRDLRFFDAQPPPLLPDGLARRGLSVMCALSAWATHTSCREDGTGWTARYERGIPAGAPQRMTSHTQGGTTVVFRPDEDVYGAFEVDHSRLEHVLQPFTRHLDISVSRAISAAVASPSPS